MEEETKKTEETKEVEENNVLVVKELPKTSLRVAKDEASGETYDLITTEEALTDILKTVKELKEGVLGK